MNINIKITLKPHSVNTKWDFEKINLQGRFIRSRYKKSFVNCNLYNINECFISIYPKKLDSLKSGNIFFRQPTFRA